MENMSNYSTINSLTRKPNESRCPCLTSGEDYHQTTIFPKCGGNYKYCKTYKGYCPVRDD